MIMKLKKRLITAIILAAIMIPLVFVRDTMALPIFFSLVSVLASYEILKLTGFLKIYLISVPSFLFCASGTLLAYFFEASTYYRLTFSIILIYLLLLAVEYTLSAAKDSSAFSAGHKTLSSVCITAFFNIYVYGGFSSLVLLNCDETINHEHGLFFLILIFVIAYMSDTFAYLIGSLFGKHKLIPRVSPNKTVEGAVAGLIASVIFTVGWFLLYNSFLADKDKILIYIPLLIILAVFGTLCSMLGDLLMSALKRSYGISDFSKILPGHGGILDRFDSVLAVSIILYAILNNYNLLFG